MKTKKTTGEDYVHPVHGNIMPDFLGLTKREYFAAMALQGLSGKDVSNTNMKTVEDVCDAISSTAVLLADSLIKELNKEQ